MDTIAFRKADNQVTRELTGSWTGGELRQIGLSLVQLADSISVSFTPEHDAAEFTGQTAAQET